MSTPVSSFEHHGAQYLRVLKQLHTVLKPATYFEIGTQTGQSLALAQCRSLAVDPHFLVEQNVMVGKPCCTFYQDTSDRFFQQATPQQFLGGPIDLAFLDGMHWYEFLLRDFYQTEAHCRPNSVIALHDCVPPDAHVGRRLAGDMSLGPRSQFPEWWAGDVWKALLILKQARPELKILCLDAPPTGLVLVTNLDPGRAGAWHAGYHDHIAAWRDQQLTDYGIDKLRAEVRVHSTSILDDAERLSTYFWL